jgi:hypothetical protein
MQEETDMLKTLREEALVAGLPPKEALLLRQAFFRIKGSSQQLSERLMAVTELQKKFRRFASPCMPLSRQHHHLSRAMQCK